MSAFASGCMAELEAIRNVATEARICVGRLQELTKQAPCKQVDLCEEHTVLKQGSDVQCDTGSAMYTEPNLASEPFIQLQHGVILALQLCGDMAEELARVSAGVEKLDHKVMSCTSDASRLASFLPELRRRRERSRSPPPGLALDTPKMGDGIQTADFGECQVDFGEFVSAPGPLSKREGAEADVTGVSSLSTEAFFADIERLDAIASDRLRAAEKQLRLAQTDLHSGIAPRSKSYPEHPRAGRATGDHIADEREQIFHDPSLQWLKAPEPWRKAHSEDSTCDLHTCDLPHEPTSSNVPDMPKRDGFIPRNVLASPNTDALKKERTGLIIKRDTVLDGPITSSRMGSSIEDQVGAPFTVYDIVKATPSGSSGSLSMSLTDHQAAWC